VIVETRSGRIRGQALDGLTVFKGIPFARPPVGELRFRAPEREESWSGVRDALDFGPSAPQQPLMLPLPGMDVGEQDEDCLYLNVYTPAADDARRPVLVWIHGGGFVIGSGSQPIYDGGPLARHGDVVVVSLNYRLGPLGFMLLSDLCPELEGAVGNAGIRDQIAALEWVRDGIEAFGGDPDNVTIFGESAGGMSVGSLLGSPGAAGLFQKAIAQSGAAHNVHTRETATQVAESFLAELALPPADAARSLRQIPPDKLLDTHRQTMLKLGSSLGLLPFQPLVDGDVLPVAPLDAVRGGSARGVALLAGTTRDEWRLFGMLDPGLAKLDQPGLEARLADQLPGVDVPALIDAYRTAPSERGEPNITDLYYAIETDRVFRLPAIRLVEAQRSTGAQTFMYRFDWPSPAMGGALGACHGLELAFVFGMAGGQGVELFAGGGPDAKALSDVMLDSWVAFARAGDPSHPGLPGGRWDAYELPARKTMLLDQACALELDPAGREREVWSGVL
jgi:para-nitrobenzyl esterase